MLGRCFESTACTGAAHSPTMTAADALAAHDYAKLPPRLTTAEVSAITRLKKRSLWKRVREGRGPKPIRVGGRLLWDRDEVLRFVGLPVPA
jgi:predicted DNA-binding transcriptional regulator AlpA